MPPQSIIERIHGYAAAPINILYDVFKVLWFIAWSTGFVAIMFAFGYAIEHGLQHVIEKLNYFVREYMSRRV